MAIGARVTIPNGTATSGSIDLFGGRLQGFIMPASWTAASLSLETSPDGGTNWYPVYLQDNSLLSFTVAAGRLYILDSTRFAGLGGLVRFVSSVNQGADRIIIPLFG